MTEQPHVIGFACAYTPLPLIHAAGFVPHRLLPLCDVPDQAGALLHDNICPHVKRILDRAMAEDLPEQLSGMVLMDSCDAMRRLADAWQSLRPDDRLARLELPVTAGDGSEAFLARELGRLLGALERWSGHEVPNRAIHRSAKLYDRLALALQEYAASCDRRTLQELYNLSVTTPPEDALARLEGIKTTPRSTLDAPRSGVPVYLFGNVLPEPDALQLLEDCGARLVGDDVCTAARQLVPMNLDRDSDPLLGMARALIRRPPCARTITPENPGRLAQQVSSEARRRGARGVIAHVIKFCDPYLNRLPDVQRELKQESIPLLVLEGDCSLRSLGQHRTRIEAFIEMLETK